ncbi:MAG: hypothetical protein M0Z89_00575 [Nitrospiraceae bacterium]|nr:hypothetical protein [Nitrospiraceae bacterium]
MDTLDKISIMAIIVLAVSSLVLIIQHKSEARSDRNSQMRSTAAELSPSNDEIDSKAKLARNLLNSDSPGKAEGLLRELIQTYPYEGEPHMLMGDMLMRKQEPINAMHEYKEAIDLNIDYLDKKTPLFQGKKLKIAVGEALAEIDRRIKQNPEDESMKNEKRTIYYLYRKIAGGCGG